MATPFMTAFSVGRAVGSALGSMGLFSKLFGGGSSAPAGLSFNQQKQLQANSAKTTYDLNKKLMDYQYKLERQSRRTSFVDTKKDLTSAGYNPLLAVGNQSGYVGVSSGVSAQDPIAENMQLNTNRSSARANWAQRGIDLLNSLNGIRNTSANTALMKAQTAEVPQNAHSQRALNSAQIDHIASQTQGQNISNSIQQLTGLRQAEANIRNTDSSTQYNLRSAQNAIASTIKNYAEAQSTSAQTALERERRAEERVMRQEELEFRRKHPKQAGFLGYVERYGHAFGSVMGNNSVTVNNGPKPKKGKR